MSGVNVAVVVGHLGKDPEVRKMPNGDSVANFSIATSEKFTDKSGNKVDQTEWHAIVVYGKQADNCGQYLKKGSLAGVTGKIRTRMWEKDGTKHYKTEIIASRVQFLGSAKDGQQGGQPAADDWPTKNGTPGPTDTGAPLVEDVDTTLHGGNQDDLPF